MGSYLQQTMTVNVIVMVLFQDWQSVDNQQHNTYMYNVLVYYLIAIVERRYREVTNSCSFLNSTEITYMQLAGQLCSTISYSFKNRNDSVEAERLRF